MMQNNEHLLRFPISLPNDVYDFVLYYPRKFPLIINYYNKLVRELHMNPKKFKETCLKLEEELFAGFKKIKDDFDKCGDKDINFLVEIDQRLHKLFCYRFWIINYLFCDGPLHDYYVSKVKEYAEQIADWNEVEDKEISTLQTERDLLQGDYADLYLKQTLEGIEIYDVFY